MKSQTNLKIQTKKLKELKLFLNDRYDYYADQKEILINNPKMIEYMFNKPSTRLNTEKDLIIEYDHPIRNVALDVHQMNVQLRGTFFILNQLANIYSKQLVKFRVIAKKLKTTISYPKILFTDRNMNKSQKEINNILNKYENLNILSYVYGWSLNQKGSHTMRLKRPTINYTDTQRYDFFGATYYHNRLVLFCIQYDDESHFDPDNDFFEETHKNDVILQYILFQLNINLLRLSDGLDFRKEIKFFLKKIQQSSNYVVINKIEAVQDLFNVSNLDTRLKQFTEDYASNHNIYLKWLKNTETIDFDDEDFHDENLETNILDDDPSESIRISSNVVHEISKQKRFFHPDRTTEAENMMVELIGLEKRKN